MPTRRRHGLPQRIASFTHGGDRGFFINDDPDAVSAAGFPLPVYDKNDNLVGRMLDLSTVDGQRFADVEWFNAPYGGLEPVYATIDVKYPHQGRPTITAAVMQSLVATLPVEPANQMGPLPGEDPTPPDPDMFDDEPSGSGIICVDVELPVAPIATEWDHHTAVSRMVQNAGGNPDTLAGGFLYQDPGTDGTSADDYQFPIADMVDGTLMLVPNGLLEAATIIDAAGPATADLTDADRIALDDVLDELFDKVSEALAPLTPAGAGAEEPESAAEGGGCTDCGAGLTAASTVELPLAPPDTTWDGPAAESRVLKWATGPDGNVDATKLGLAYLFKDPNGDPTRQSTYKLPVADVIGGTLKVVPNGVRAASAALGGARGGVKGMTPAQRKTAQAAAAKLMGRVRNAAKGNTSPLAAAVDTTAPALTYTRHHNPPFRYFEPLKLGRLTPMTVTADGEVYGHIGNWAECHRSFVASGLCVPTPRSHCNYCGFHTGTVTTAEGATLDVGVYSVGGGHADTSLGAAAATKHYDDVAAGAAVGIVREDEIGPYFHGALTPYATDEHIYAMQAFPPSGDWREQRPGAGIEMIAVTSVLTPGFRTNITADGSLAALLTTNTTGYGENAEEKSTDRDNGDMVDAAHALAREAVRALAAAIGRTRADELAALNAAVHT